MINLRSIGSDWWKTYYNGERIKDHYLCTHSPTDPRIVYLLKGDDLITIQPCQDGNGEENGKGKVITSEMTVYDSLDDYFESLDRGVVIVYRIIPICFINCGRFVYWLCNIGDVWFVSKLNVREGYHFHEHVRGDELMHSIYHPYNVLSGDTKEYTINSLVQRIHWHINMGRLPTDITWYVNGKFKKCRQWKHGKDKDLDTILHI